MRKGKLRLINMLWPAATGGKDAMRLAELKYGAFKLPCDLREDLQRQFYFFGTYFAEERNLWHWQTEARSAKVVFDIGANLGIYSFAAMAVAPDAAVHAFEPTPEIAERLREAAALNRLSRLHVHAVAASSTTGFVKLRRWRGETGRNGGMNFIAGSAGEDEPDRVPAERLDDFCNERRIDRIDLLKIDVQGHEAEVLRGAAGLLNARRVGMIFFELNWASDSQRPCPASQSIGLLEEYGYRFSEAGKVPAWRQSGAWMRPLTDIVALPESEG